jgi:predicted Zn-dependent protease
MLLNIVKKAIFLIVVSFFISGCAKDLITGKKTLNYYNLQDEPKIGQYVLLEQERALKKQKKEIDSEKDKEDLERLRKIVARIASVSHYPQFPYEVHLADADIVNAWCAPGGKVMVYTGLWDPKKGLVEKDNDDQLAAVLAHEIAHATARHVTEAISRNMTIAFVGTVISAGIAAGGYEQGSNLFGEIFSEGMDIFVPSYSRKNESEADAIGLMYMAKAGYDPRVAVELWKKAAQKRKDRTSIYASHPASGERARHLEELLPQAMEFYEKAKASQP